MKETFDEDKAVEASSSAEKLTYSSSSEQLTKTPSRHRRHGATGVSEVPRQLRMSRLPKRPNAYPSVAELVKRYQDILPSSEYANPRQSVIIGQAALSAYESDRDAEQRPRLTHRKTKGKSTQKRNSSTDFDNGYAANIGTKYLANERKIPAASTALAPGPRRMTNMGAFSSGESRGPSRRTSPDKRAALGRTGIPGPVTRIEVIASSTGRISSAPGPGKTTKAKQKAGRPPSMVGRSTLRKPPTTPGSKVSNLTRQFERIHKDNERANRRYTVLRGKKARPVATARAKVEVFDNIEDAIRDMSDDSDSSSEADDEDDGQGEGQGDEDGKLASSSEVPIPPVVVNEPSPATVAQDIEPGRSQSLPTSSQSLPRTPVPRPSPLSGTATDAEGPSPSSGKKEHPQLSLDLPPYPTSPALPPFFSDGRSTSPPPSDIESTPGNERHSFMRALSGFWPPPLVASPASGRRIRLEPGGEFDELAWVLFPLTRPLTAHTSFQN